jgi:hypothetical protein
MPKAVSEVSDGNQFSRSLNQGQIADSATRTFRIILNSPSEAFDIQASCGVFIGNAHPVNPNLACTNFDAKYEGETRMVFLATFSYASAPAASGVGSSEGQNPKTISPEYRPANWTISTELSESPLRRWRLRASMTEWGEPTKTVNPVGDMYEGLSTLKPMTTIKVTQFVLGGADDPTKHCRYVGYINSDTFQLGSLQIDPHELMLRSITATPTVEPWGSLVRKGWSVDYAFLFNETIAEVNFDEEGEAAESIESSIGWDAAIIVEGRNVKAFNPADADAWKDPYGQPLKPGPDGAPLDPDNLSLPEGVDPDSKQRAHVAITGFSERGMSQSPAGEPIALNLDGTPRKISSTRPPIVRAYQIYESIPMVGTLQLRLT